MSPNWSNTSDMSNISSDEYKDKETSIYFADTSEQIFCPWIELSEDQIPLLILPCSSSDLLVDKDHLFDTLEVLINTLFKYNYFRFMKFYARIVILFKFHLFFLKIFVLLLDLQLNQKFYVIFI